MKNDVMVWGAKQSAFSLKVLKVSLLAAVLGAWLRASSKLVCYSQGDNPFHLPLSLCQCPLSLCHG